ncbi:MAG: DUF1287 domain-containing protein [Myxococcota bacterium]
MWVFILLALPFGEELSQAALERTKHEVRYDGSYQRIDYPGGDVPADIGVCTDVVVRSYRTLGIDLQKLVHEDMRGAFSKYPPRWGLKGPDRNIDHRRVPNLRRFFERRGASLPVTRERKDYRPGDVVSWTVSGNRPHIGIVVDGGFIVHNIGLGPKREDVLFAYPITGHYRFKP